MKLSELVTVLQGQLEARGDVLVLMAGTPEGNYFSAIPADFMSNGLWNGEDYYNDDEDEDEIYGEVEPVLCLWPS